LLEQRLHAIQKIGAQINRIFFAQHQVLARIRHGSAVRLRSRPRPAEGSSTKTRVDARHGTRSLGLKLNKNGPQQQALLNKLLLTPYDFSQQFYQLCRNLWSYCNRLRTSTNGAEWKKGDKGVYWQMTIVHEAIPPRISSDL